MLKNISDSFNDFLSLIFPRNCLCCDTVLMRQEKIICSKCNIGLPRTYFHLVDNNPVEQAFWGRANIEKATSFFFFKKGSKYQKLMHYLKYKNMPQVGVMLGRKFGAELLQNNYFGNVDVIMPVPLHKKKKRKRGYNQSLMICNGLSDSMGIPVESKVLYRTHFSESQTRKGRFERWENMKELFNVHNSKLIMNKHVLLVDDILTTGATLEACIQALQKVEGVKVNIITLAYTSL